MFGALVYMAQRLDTKKIVAEIFRDLKCGAGGDWRLKWSEKVTNEQFFKRREEKRRGHF